MNHKKGSINDNSCVNYLDFCILSVMFHWAGFQHWRQPAVSYLQSALPWGFLIMVTTGYATDAPDYITGKIWPFHLFQPAAASQQVTCFWSNLLYL